MCGLRFRSLPLCGEHVATNPQPPTPRPCRHRSLSSSDRAGSDAFLSWVRVGVGVNGGGEWGIHHRTYLRHPSLVPARYGVTMNNAILAEEKHVPIYAELIEKYPVEFIAGGATQNSMRVAQWVAGKPGMTTMIGCIGENYLVCAPAALPPPPPHALLHTHILLSASVWRRMAEGRDAGARGAGKRVRDCLAHLHYRLTWASLLAGR